MPSAEYTYFVSCADHARLCGGQCSKDLPVLAVIGEIDPYFGAQPGSAAADVAAAPNGDGSPTSGNCRAALDKQGFSKSVTVVFKGTAHSIMYKNDNALRSVISDFLADPAAATTQPVWASVNRPDCTFANGVYRCEETQSVGDPCVGYLPNTEAPWQNLGAIACPSAAPAPAEATVSVTDAAILGGVIGAIIVILLAVLAAMKLTRGTAEKSPTTPPTFTSAAEPPI